MLAIGAAKSQMSIGSIGVPYVVSRGKPNCSPEHRLHRWSDVFTYVQLDIRSPRLLPPADVSLVCSCPTVWALAFYVFYGVVWHAWSSICLSESFTELWVDGGHNKFLLPCLLAAFLEVQSSPFLLPNIAAGLAIGISF